MIENLSNKIVSTNITMTLINDFIEIEKIYQHNLFKFVPNSGNMVVKKNNCINRDLNFWQVSSDNLIRFGISLLMTNYQGMQSFKYGI